MSELKHTYEQKWEEANACAREWMQKLADDKVEKDYKDCVVSFCEAFTGGSWDDEKKEWDYSGIANAIMVTGHFDKVLNAETTTEKKIQMISGYATYQSFKKDYESITNRLSAAKNDRLQDLDASLKVAKKIAMENCKKSLKELNDVKDRDLLTNTKKALANADKAVAKALNDVKEIPKCLNGFLENIMFGWTTQLPNLAEMTFDADAVVDKIMAVLEKLLALDAVIPPPPALHSLRTY